MRERYSGSLLAIAILTMGASVPFESADAQAPTSVTASACPDDHHAIFHDCALKTAQTENPRRTADGKPDFSGYWRKIPMTSAARA